ncbi:ATP-binding protein [Aliisedimentitalea scapharcae]|uniref:histidine kinase n=1 Tax=Aliisedimentitalea scapharcae TaxID=1524259 RepID=A0ABZ2XM56_9RHOB
MISRNSSPIPGRNATAPEHARLAAVLVMSAMLAAAGFAFDMPVLAERGVLAASLTLVLVAIGVTWRTRIQTRARNLATDLLTQFIEKDAVPSFVTDEDGAIQACNMSADLRFQQTKSDTLAGSLRAVLSNPTAILYRLQCRAKLDGAAREDVVTRRGHVRLAVHQLGETGFLWRVEDMPEKPHQGRGPEAMPVPMVTVGRSGTVLFMNDAARTLVGQRVKSLKALFATLPVQPGRVNTLTTASGPTQVFAMEVATSVGRQELFFLPVRETPSKSRITDFETLPVPLLRVNAKGEILAANTMAATMLGQTYRTGMMIGEVMEGLGRPLEDWLTDTIAGSAVQKSEFLRLKRRDKEVFVQVTLSRVPDEDRRELIAVLNDATELKTLEAQFVQSQKMQAIGQLAGGVAHDFNNLLTAISGHCDLLLLRHDQGDPDFGDLIQINENANRAAALVSQLLAFSRKQTLRPETLDLRDTLSDLTHLLNRLVGEKVTLTLSHDPVLSPIRADKRQLEQVLMNLVVNARDAMPNGGEIRIQTEVVHLDAPLERDRATVPSGEYVVVKVSDEGMGIEADNLQKIFEPFFTTKRTGEGTGLGLSTAYGIIKQTGGFIFVDSVPGSGTQFTLFFPCHDLEPHAPKPMPKSSVVTTPVAGDGVVLLVEDEAPVRAFASRALRLRGYTVLEAESAEDALKTLEDQNLSVDVFVTDVVMPGMDGPSWVREALKVRPDVRVVFVSGYAEGAFGDAKPEIPNSVFLPKPFSLTQLTETVFEQMH